MVKLSVMLINCHSIKNKAVDFAGLLGTINPEMGFLRKSWLEECIEMLRFPRVVSLCIVMLGMRTEVVSFYKFVTAV